MLPFRPHFVVDYWCLLHGRHSFSSCLNLEISSFWLPTWVSAMFLVLWTSSLYSRCWLWIAASAWLPSIIIPWAYSFLWSSNISILRMHPWLRIGLVVGLGCWFRYFLQPYILIKEKTKKLWSKTKKLWSTWKTINENIKRRKKHTDDGQTDRHKYDIWEFWTSFQRKGRENGMKVFRAKFLGLPWKRHESGMKATWIWDEYDMVDFDNFGVFKGKCHEGAMNLPWKIVESHCIIFMSYSYTCHFHGTFMAFSWHFDGTLTATPKNMAPNNSCHFHGRFMGLSWHFLPLQNCHAQVNQIHVTFMALSFKVQDCH